MKVKEQEFLPIELLKKSEHIETEYGEDKEKALLLEEVLASFKYHAKVVSVVHGNKLTVYELMPPAGVSIRKIEKCLIDIEYAMGAHGRVRLVAPMSGSRNIALEIPNNKACSVGLREVIESEEFRTMKYPLAFAVGKNSYSEIVVDNLRVRRNILIAGATDSGKTTFLNSMIVSLLFSQSLHDVKFALIDLKKSAFNNYVQLPNLFEDKVAFSFDDAKQILEALREETKKRVNLLEKYKAISIEEFNKLKSDENKIEGKLPYIVCVIDEYAELRLGNFGQAIEKLIVEIIQMSKKIGIHFVIATQICNAQNVSGLLKANIPNRIAFATANQIYSRMILEESGAEMLMGKGDMLYSLNSIPMRLQGAYVSNEEICAVVNYVHNNYRGL